jgi:uncharacterized protein (DUF2336 family)
MGAPHSIISELEDAIHSGSPEKRVQTLRRVTDLFLSEADRLNETQIGVFDDVLSQLITRIEARAMAELSARLAPVGKAPIGVVRRLAQDDEISIAGPVLTHSPRLTDDDLVDIAKRKSQQHLLAMAGRETLAEVVTDVLVTRGDREVKYRVAGNAGAKLSETGHEKLVTSAENDEGLAEKIVLRIDLPVRLLKELLPKATEAVRISLLATVPADRRDVIQETLVKISNEVGAEVAVPRDFFRAVHTVLEMQKKGALDEGSLLAFANTRRYEETVAALAALSATSVELVAPLMKSARIDGLLVAAKGAGLSWPVAKAVLDSRKSRRALTEAELSEAHDDYAKLSQASAQRTLRFWQVRVAAG